MRKIGNQTTEKLLNILQFQTTILMSIVISALVVSFVAFPIQVSGNSMEPTLHDGETIWVHMQPTLENGEIGIFLLDGDAYVKEYRCDETGCYLISHNKAYAPKKITEYNETKIYGKVVYPVR